MPWSHDHASDLLDIPKVTVIFAPPEDLQLSPGVGARLAKYILFLRESHGNLYAEFIRALMRRPLRPEIRQTLDFTRNSELRVLEEGLSGWYNSNEESVEHNHVRLRLTSKLRNSKEPRVRA